MAQWVVARNADAKVLFSAGEIGPKIRMILANHLYSIAKGLPNLFVQYDKPASLTSNGEHSF